MAFIPADVQTRRHIRRAVTVLGLALPVVIYLWFIQTFAVNVVWGDQWADVNVIRHSFEGTLNLSTLWTQHNEERMLFPNLVVVLLTRTTHFNLIIEMYMSAALLLIATALIISAHRRRSPSTHWIYYCPIVILLFSLVQYGDTLWGYQIAWYMVLAALAAVLFLLDRARLTWLTLLGAIAFGVLGSYSLFQGMLIWPAGLLLLFVRRRRAGFLVAWIGAALLTAAIYFVNFNRHLPGVSSPSYSLKHPLAAIQFLLTAIGDVIGVPISTHGNAFVMLLGACIAAIAVWTLTKYGFHTDETTSRPIGIYFISYGLLYAVTFTIGRAPMGLPFAGGSIYSLLDLLILVGCYLTLFDHASVESHVRADVVSLPERSFSALRFVQVLLIVTILLQVPFGLVNGLRYGSQKHSTLLAAENVIVNANQASDSILYGIYFVGPAQYVREMVPVLRDRRLTFFADNERTRQLSNEGLLVGTWGDAQTYPLEPWKGVHDGQSISISSQYLGVPPGQRLLVSECASSVLFGQEHACLAPHAINTARSVSGYGQARYQLRGDTAGASCTAGSVCYLKVWTPGDAMAASYAELRIAEN